MCAPTGWQLGTPHVDSPPQSKRFTVKVGDLRNSRMSHQNPDIQLPPIMHPGSCCFRRKTQFRGTANMLHIKDLFQFKAPSGLELESDPRLTPPKRDAITVCDRRQHGGWHSYHFHFPTPSSGLKLGPFSPILVLAQHFQTRRCHM